MKRTLGIALVVLAVVAGGVVELVPGIVLQKKVQRRRLLQVMESLSPCLIGMEACLRMPGPETLESKIFGRLSAWQNWIFQRPNAIGDTGALTRYGTGVRAEYDKRRV